MDAYSTSPNVRTSSSRCTYIGDVCKTNKTAKANNTPAITETAGRQANRQATSLGPAAASTTTLQATDTWLQTHVADAQRDPTTKHRTERGRLPACCLHS
jgi:hypothetical protein